MKINNIGQWTINIYVAVILYCVMFVIKKLLNIITIVIITSVLRVPYRFEIIGIFHLFGKTNENGIHTC